MAVRKFLARDFAFYISEDSGSTWTEISGLNSWTFATDSNDEDTSTFDNGAWGSTMYTQRTGSVALEGFWLVDASNGNRDAGQLKVQQAATKVGYEAYRDFRIECVPASGGVRGTSIGGFRFVGQAGMGDQGGNVTDVMPFNVDLIFEGKPTGSGVFNVF